MIFFFRSVKTNSFLNSFSFSLSLVFCFLVFLFFFCFSVFVFLFSFSCWMRSNFSMTFWFCCSRENPTPTYKHTYYTCSIETLSRVVRDKKTEEIGDFGNLKPGINFALIEEDRDFYSVYYKSGKIVHPYRSPLSISSLLNRVSFVDTVFHSRYVVYLRPVEYQLFKSIK